MASSSCPSNGFAHDCLPPEGEYQTRDELYTAINAWAAPRNYAFITGKSKKTTSGRQIVYYCCDRSGTYSPRTTTRVRDTATRRTGCQFSIVAKQSYNHALWQVTHRQGAQFSQHNHEPSLGAISHSSLRKLSAENRSTIQKLTNTGLKPKEIRTFIRENTDATATQQDVYNAIAQSKRDVLKGQSSIHALANELDKEG